MCSFRRRAFAFSSGDLRCTPRISAGAVNVSLFFSFFILINDLLCYVKSRVRLFTDGSVIYLRGIAGNSKMIFIAWKNGNQTGACNLLQANATPCE